MDIKSFDKPNLLKTSPWANAIKTRENIVEKIEYPNLDGMRTMLIIPNDYYRKKLMPLGPGYIATAMQQCGIDVSSSGLYGV